jgi:hypothetical protein
MDIKGKECENMNRIGSRGGMTTVFDDRSLKPMSWSFLVTQQNINILSYDVTV